MTTPRWTSTSLRRSSAISPYRMAHHAPSSTANRNRPGMFAAMASSSDTSAGRMRFALDTRPAPPMWQGFRASTFCSVAVEQIARKSWEGCARSVGISAFIPSCQVATRASVTQQVPVKVASIVGLGVGP